MNKQRPFLEVKSIAEDLLPGLQVPAGVGNARPFLEGVIGCCETKGHRNLTKNPYKKAGLHYDDWETGWDYASEQMNNTQEPKFLKTCAA